MFHSSRMSEHVCREILSRACLRPVFIGIVLLLMLSGYLLLYESSVSHGVDHSAVPDFLSTAFLRNLNNEVTVPQNATNRDGCRRLWLKGESVWFDQKFDGSLSPLWTEDNMELAPEVIRWWMSLQAVRLTGTSISEEFEAVLDEVDLPDDPYRVRDVSRCLRCAVVGNSGNLRNSNYGTLIDSHDFVFRINKAPTKGFSKDVGSKETHRFMYPESFVDPDPGVYFILMNFKLFDIAWLTSALTNGSITRTYARVRKNIQVNRTKIMIYNPAFMYHVHTEWVEKHGRYPSTGHLAMFFALQICDEVDLFGYGANKLGNWDHYWQKDDGSHNSFFIKKTGVHDSVFEKSVMAHLRKAGKIKIYPGVR